MRAARKRPRGPATRRRADQGRRGWLARARGRRHDGPRVPRLRRHGHRAGRGARRRRVHRLRLGARGQHHRVGGAVRGEQRRRLVGRGPVRVSGRWVRAGRGRRGVPEGAGRARRRGDTGGRRSAEPSRPRAHHAPASRSPRSGPAVPAAVGVPARFPGTCSPCRGPSGSGALRSPGPWRGARTPGGPVVPSRGGPPAAGTSCFSGGRGASLRGHHPSAPLGRAAAACSRGVARPPPVRPCGSAFSPCSRLPQPRVSLSSLWQLCGGARLLIRCYFPDGLGGKQVLCVYSPAPRPLLS